MKLKLNRVDAPEEVHKLSIIIGETEYRITENIYQGGILINKSNDEDSALWAHPVSSNEIHVK